MYKFIFKKYLSWMAARGGYRPQPHTPSSDGGTSRKPNHEFELADRHAIQCGEQYRGASVLVGILGIIVVCVAVTPAALHIHSEAWLKVLGALKVVLMLGILYLVNPWGRIPVVSKAWIESRRKAEELRYSELKKIKEDLAQFIENPEYRTNLLRNELVFILNGPQGQVAYNRSKGEMYKAIEHCAEKWSWIGFIGALACACLLLISEFDILPHITWLLYGTAAVPAVVGGVHGINGALKIGSLAEEHTDMANLLQGLNDELEATSHDDEKSILSIAERTYSQLVDRDVLWGESTAKGSKLKPA